MSVGDMGENFGDWRDRGENGVRACEKWRGFSPGSPRLPTFPFPLTLGHKYEPRAYIRFAIIFPP